MRSFSTSRIVDKLFNLSQISSTHEQRKTEFRHFINNYFQQEETNHPGLINDVIHRWSIEQPTKEALLTYEPHKNECQKLTFNDIYKQSSRIANVLTGKGFNLTPGQSVLVILPETSQERILLQLACLQSGLIFCPYESKDLTNIGISERLKKLTVDCIISNKDNLELLMNCTHNPIRPLKKGLITNCSKSEPLPVGWNNLLQITNDVESQYTKKPNIQSNTPVMRQLSNNNVVEYSYENFNARLMLTAFWLNMNKSSELVWMKNQNEIISIAPWLFGSTIFHKEIKNLQTLFNTLENYPIDTFCGSTDSYQMLDNQQQKQKQENYNHLEQLFSTESVDENTKEKWYSLTHLHIHDDYTDFNYKSMTNCFSNADKQNPDNDTEPKQIK